MVARLMLWKKHMIWEACRVADIWDLGSSARSLNDFTLIAPAARDPQPTDITTHRRDTSRQSPATGAPIAMYKQATQRTTEVLSMPTQWLGMYSDFITKNSSAVTQIESALRSLTYIIPGTNLQTTVARHVNTDCT